MPLPLSSFTGRITPRTPLYSRSSDESLDRVCSGDCNQYECHHLAIPQRSASALGSYQSPRLSTSDISPSLAAPVSNQPTYNQPSYIIDRTLTVPSPGVVSSQQPTPTNNHNHNNPYIKTPTGITINIDNRYSDGTNGYTPRHSDFANGVPSPPLEPEVFEGGQADGSEALKAGKFIPQASMDFENTWPPMSKRDEGVVPENVQQLIWETDEAFKAVSAALAEVKQISQSHPQAKELQAQLRHLQHTSQVLQLQQTQGMDKLFLQTQPILTQQPPSTRGLMSPLSPTSGRGMVASRKSSSPLSPSPNILRSPTRGTSIAKTKKAPRSPGRPKTPRSATHDSSPSKSGSSSSSKTSNNTHRYQHSYHRSLSRLNLAADNVTEKLFNGPRARFGLSRLEADEVVTPGQVQQFRQARLAKAQAEAQAEARRTTSNETLRSAAGSIGDGYSSEVTTENTPIEPFHLQDLPSRIGNSGVNPSANNVLSPVPELSTPRSFEFNNKDVIHQAPIVAEPRTPTDMTKGANHGQALLATPPPTPPQPSANATFTSDAALQAAIADEDEVMYLRNLGLHTVPTSNGPKRPTHTRGNSSSSRILLLPTIPEVRITAPRGHDVSTQAQPQGSQSPKLHSDEPAMLTDDSPIPYFEEDDDHMFFASPAYTETMPTIKHGRIRLAKADLVNAGAINSLESKLLTSPDETLDWTAFQMAILGGAGDLCSDPNDFLTRDAQEDLRDDLCDWLEGLGFSNNGLGSLQTKEEDVTATTTPVTPHHLLQIAAHNNKTRSPSKSPSDSTRNRHRRNVSNSSSLDSVSEEVTEVDEMVQSQSMPIPVITEHPSGFWNTRPFDASRFFTGSGCGIKRWTLEGHPKRYQGPSIDVDKANTLQRSNTGTNGLLKSSFSVKSGRQGTLRESVDSLPQSPMLDLVMTTAVDGSKDFVPMGYNLGHDLGDFLKWESEHAYASGFFGSD